MKLLLDMGLSPSTAQFLQQLNHDAVHLGRRGQAKLADEEIVRLAEAEDRIVVTLDLDFARIVALQRLARPSIVLFRLERYTTDEVNSLLRDLLATYETELTSGAIVVVDPHRIRLRTLPIW
jgi:predicted nuclease of predicted toxin-antitoxin system